MSELSLVQAGGPELNGLPAEFLETAGADLLSRWDCHQRFWDARLAAGLDPYFRTSAERMGPRCVVLNRGLERIAGVNFASQDYLSLSSHPLICAAAVDAIGRWGVHAGGSMALQGGSLPLLAVEERLAELFGCREITIFPTGSAAGYGAIRALVREDDHIVIDALAQDCLRQGAADATKNVHNVPNCSHVAVERCLARIRERNARAGILVITEALFALDSTVPDLRRLQNLCRERQATLLVATAHDFGAIGDGGLGFCGEQGMIGEIDLVVGSFSKTFASSGGFVASSASGIRQALRIFSGSSASSNAMSPVQAAIVNAALTVVRSREGVERRARLMYNVSRLRDGLAARAFRVFGTRSPIVPVWLGDLAEARLMTRAMMSRGVLVNLVEPPPISRQNARWCLLVMADHDDDQVDAVVAAAAAAREALGAAASLPRAHRIDPPPPVASNPD